MDDLVEWLRAQLDERERVARAACHSGEGRWHQTDPDREHGRIEDESGEVVTYDEGSPSGYQAAHIVRHDPATVLREVEAQLRIMDLHRLVRKRSTSGIGEDIIEDCQMCDHFPAQYPCATIRLLALPLADLPGYRSEWAPSARRVNQT